MKRNSFHSHHSSCLHIIFQKSEFFEFFFVYVAKHQLVKVKTYMEKFEMARELEVRECVNARVQMGRNEILLREQNRVLMRK